MEEIKEVKKSLEVKQKLIYTLQELEGTELNEKYVDSEEAIVNLALINLLFDFNREYSIKSLINKLSHELIDFHEEVFPTVESKISFIKSEKLKLENLKLESEKKIKEAEKELALFKT